MTLPWIAERAAATPNDVALFFEGTSVTFAALARGMNAVAKRLATAGASERSRLAVLMAPSPRFVELLHAAQQLRAVFAPLHLRLSETEWSAQLEKLRPSVLLYDREHADVARSLRDRLPWLSILETDEELDRLSPTDIPTARPADDDVLTILFTSGTTAAAKAVMLTNGNHAASAHAVLRHLGCRATDRWLCALPLYHVGGLSILVRSAISGMPTVLHPRFDPTAVNRALFNGEATIASLVATMLVRLLAEAGSRRYPATLRAAVLGGGPVTSALVGQAESAGMRVVATYGLTETASQITATRISGEALENPGSAGRPLEGASVRIEAPDSAGVGEILVRGTQVMPGYYGEDRATARVLTDGWLRTGDLGRIDRDGRLFVVTRLGDVIVTGGEKVVPEEVEAVLMAHPAVADAGVFGRSDPEWGQRVCASIVPRDQQTIDENGLRTWCAERLASYKIPSRFEWAAELPRTAGGKLRRSLLGEGSPES